MVNWRVYYGDGSTFSNEDGPPQDAPPGNVMCVVWYDQDNRRKISHNADYYIYDEARHFWYGCDAGGLWQYLAEPGYKIVKMGRMAADLKFREIFGRADRENPLEGTQRQ